MRIELKKKRDNAFFIITFLDEGEKKFILNGIRLAVKNSINVKYRKDYYKIIKKLSDRCRHDYDFQQKNEIATLLFYSEISEILEQFIALIACLGDLSPYIDKYYTLVEEHCTLAKKYEALSDKYYTLVKELSLVDTSSNKNKINQEIQED